MSRIAYLDCNATTPLEPSARDTLIQYLDVDFGNAASHTHQYGAAAAAAVSRARREVSSVIGREPEEVLFTSGATESNNLAILGLAQHGFESGRKHVVTTAIEHKSVLETFSQIEALGFEVDVVQPTTKGIIDAQDVMNAVREDTLLVSIMHVNNETGIIQPVAKVAEELSPSVFLHVDAAQGFCKETTQLADRRIDLISVSGHKVYGPKGIGALIARRRVQRILKPRQFGGGHERGLRSGTLPTPLIAAFGAGCKYISNNHDAWVSACQKLRSGFHKIMDKHGFSPITDTDIALPNTLLMAHPTLSAEVVIMCTRDRVAVSTGSACTSSSVEPSHVLKAIGFSDDEAFRAVRISWCHLTSPDAVSALDEALEQLPK